MAANEVNTVGAAAATVAMIPFWSSGDWTGSHGKRGHSNSGVEGRKQVGFKPNRPINKSIHSIIDRDCHVF